MDFLIFAPVCFIFSFLFYKVLFCPHHPHAIDAVGYLSVFSVRNAVMLTCHIVSVVFFVMSSEM